ncbi:chaplin family protein [Actinoallomurus acaciae]|uniref:Chaplin family protein n=1 Tax=Actinoallomurus acaciae TaxID=502577 RepID=A0ABV5YCN6_9ACTN
MHKWTARAARVALVAAAVSAASVGVANADDTTGDHSILGGNQLHIPIIAPIGLFGNHVNVLSSVVPGSGFRYSHVRMDEDPTPQVDICGNAIANAQGVGTAACKGQANIGATEAAPAAIAAAAPIAAPIAPEARPVEMSTSGENGVLSGNQVKAPVHAPIRICGNAGALGGMATAACEGTASTGRIGGTAARGFGVAGLLG